MSATACRIELRQGGATIARVDVDGRELPKRVELDATIPAQRPIEVRLTRGTVDGRPPATRGEVRIGESLQLVLRPGQAEGGALITSLGEEYGEVLLDYVELDGAEGPVEIASLRFEIEPAESIRALYDQLVTDLERIHVGLARDVVGRSRQRTGFGRRTPRASRPEEDCELLERTLRRLTDALERIQVQPVSAIARDVVRDRWRPGDRLASDAASTLLQDPDTVVVDGQLRRLGRVRLSRSRPTLDIPEHRAMRSELEDLARRARRVARHCQLCIDRLAEERRRWGGERADGSSVFQLEHRPRMRRYSEVAERAHGLADAFVRLRRRASFLDDVGASRSGLAPTPLFRNGRGYREAYQALVEARRAAAPLVAGDEFGVQLRSLSRLFEYWCFVQVVERLRGWFGTPEPWATYRITDEIWRPDLRSGQWFRFAAADGIAVRVHYEPDIVPADWVGDTEVPYRASLSNAPLRPDVLVEVLADGAPARALVLDAKSRASFGRDDLFEPTDYRSRIFDPRDGTQPVRQVFLLHRDERVGPLENLPRYLAGTAGTIDSSVIGAVALLPWSGDDLTRVLRRFLVLAAGPLDVLAEDPGVPQAV